MKKLGLILPFASALALAATGMVTDARAAGGGTIQGTVKYDGSAPKPKAIEVSKDKEVCGLKPHFEQDLIVGDSGGIQYAVISIPDAKGDVKPSDVKFDQKGCQYEPHVLAFPAGSTVLVENDDGILHNIHTYSTKNSPVNMAQPKFKKELKVPVKEPELIKVTCDAHGWMSGYWYSSANPYYAVTDDKGAFTISDVPPGDYTLHLWHEKLGEDTQKVTVKAGATANANFTLKPKS